MDAMQRGVKFRKIAAKLGKLVKLAVNKMTTSHIYLSTPMHGCVRGGALCTKMQQLLKAHGGGAEKMQKSRFKPSKKTLPFWGV